MGRIAGGVEAAGPTTGERSVIEARLSQVLQRPVDVADHYVLDPGISGAATYRVVVDGAAAVLKVTAASAAPYVRERARREVAFYREMAPRIPLRTPDVIAMHADCEGYALLLAAYEPAPSPDAWPTSQYLLAAAHIP